MSVSALGSAAQDAAVRHGANAGRTVIQVGAGRPIQTVAEAALRVQDGDTVEVDAGDYVGDVAVWSKSNITLRAVGGRARLIAGGAAAEGKAIWVVRGERMTISGFDFSGARVPDKNGAGIRLEKGTLTVQDCTFTDNQNGILTSNNPTIALDIMSSEFGHNGAGDGKSHNLYVGAISRLSVSGSYFHHAKVGHLLKSRAAVNHILYNRLTDEIGGRASYEMEFANGGVAYVIGNIIQQSSQTDNPHLISFGAEGYTWPTNALYLMNNTLVDLRPKGGIFLRIKPGEVTVKAANNLLVGQGTFDTAGPGDYRNNFTVDRDEFELAARDDYRLSHSSKLLGKAIVAGAAAGVSLTPDHEYVHPRQAVRLTVPARHPGALQSLK